MELMLRVWPPMSTIENTCVGLLVPTVMLPKLAVVGNMVAAGPVTA